jgi:site-specific DNA recombinase
MRVAIWAAVSTVSQATPDKVSIQVQLQKGREFISARQLTAAGEYIVPGESRTRYISLYHAEKEIEPLHALLEAAQRKEFDLLFIYDLNRFRTLMRQIFDVLCDYNIQIYIHTNPREPVQDYTEEHKTAVGMIVDFSNIISRNETNSLRRHFQEKMPARIKRGLDARLGRTPFGYKRIHPGDKDNPLIIDPPKARLVKQMAEWYLKGESLKGICRNLNENKTPSPDGGIWRPQTVSNILTSPFYAGIVYFGLSKYHRDRRTGKESRSVNPSPLYQKGKHKPLWDEATHQKLIDIHERRGKGNKGRRSARLSRLLTCFCGKKLHLDTTRLTHTGKPYPRWACSSRLPGHTFISDKKALALVIPAIVEAIRKTPNLPEPKQKQDLTEDTHEEIKELQKKKKRWLDLYENEQLDAPTLTERLKSVQNQLDIANAQLAKQRASQTRRESSSHTRARLAQILDTLEAYYLKAPPAQVNADLHDIIDHIQISKAHKIKIKWRGEE